MLSVTVRFIPSCEYLIFNYICVDRVDNFEHTGTILDSKLNCKYRIGRAVAKARRNILIRNRLSFLRIAKSVRIRHYVIFLKAFLYHLSTIYGHVSRASQKNPNSVIKLAGQLGTVGLMTLMLYTTDA